MNLAFTITPDEPNGVIITLYDHASGCQMLTRIEGEERDMVANAILKAHTCILDMVQASESAVA